MKHSRKLYCMACDWSFTYVTEAAAHSALTRHWQNNHWTPETQEPQGAHVPPPIKPEYP